MTTATLTPYPHSRGEDAMALLVGTLLIAFGLMLVREGGVMTGGTAGIALYLHYAFGYAFGLTFFTLNLPFYYLAFRRMGRVFTFKTFIAIGLVSLFSDQVQHFITLQQIQPLFAAVIGNIILGVGFLVLFRHRASLGGLNILALFLQVRFGWRAGWLQMGADILILSLSLTLMSWPVLAVSVLGAVLINLIIALNHRSGRYHA
jgi:uncharacterized membrane-anchored protein YitT (DUF2179 family)